MTKIEALKKVLIIEGLIVIGIYLMIYPIAAGYNYLTYDGYCSAFYIDKGEGPCDLETWVFEWPLVLLLLALYFSWLLIPVLLITTVISTYFVYKKSVKNGT